jgi:hypothetical protein
MKIKVINLLFWISLSYFVQGQLVLNEVSITNISTLADEENNYEDWFEIRNAGSNAININGYGISDDPMVPFKWTCPNYLLQSGEHKIIFASEKNRKPSIDHYESIVLASESWNYLLPLSEPDPSWKLPGATLSDWLEGNGGFGYGDGDDGTEINPTSSVYLRKTFVLNSVDDIERLLLYMDYDDGFVAYINGVEVARANIGTMGTHVSFDMLASDHEAIGYQGGQIDAFTIDLEQFADLLLIGENVLAIQVHNSNISSSDLTSNAYLVAGFTSSTITFSATLPWMNLIPSANWHTNFSLSTGEQLLITSSDTSISLNVTIPQLPVDHSFINNVSAWCISPTPTPSSANTGTCFSSYLDKPLFSKPAGIYASGFKIALTSTNPNAEIRYTTNGDIPSINSPLYQDSLNIDETHIISARCFDPSNQFLTSFVEKNTYLVNEAYIGLPVISISSDSVNLYDTLTGIYVFGPNDYNPTSPHFGANFWEDWERYSYIEYLATDSTQKFEGSIGLKIHGGWSRAYPQKSFRVKCRDDYGMNKIEYPLIADKPYIAEYKDFNLRNVNCCDFYGAGMSDAFMQRLTKGTHTDYMGYTPVIVFLNGEYFGVYELRETLNKDYVENNHAIPSDDVSVLTENYLVGLRANDGTLDDFWPMYNAIVEADPTSTAFYSLADSLIDLENFADYIIAETYYANGDWSSGYANNIKYWHAPGEKWRMLLMDLDFGYGSYGTLPDENFIIRATDDASIIHMDMICSKLLANPQFLTYFINRYADLINTTWQQNRVQNIGNSMLNEVAPWISRQHEMWGGNMTHFENKMINMLNWNQSRIAGARNVVQNHFALAGQVTFSLDVQPAGAGRIHISTIEPNEMEYPWSGVYFQGVPVKITAIPNPGYTFNYWSPNAYFQSSNSESEIVITPTGNAGFTAHFTGSSLLNPLQISELMVNPENSRDSDDWIELHNPSEMDIYVGGMSLTDEAIVNHFTFPYDTKIPAQGYIVIAKDTNIFKTQYPFTPFVNEELGFTLNSNSETIYLKNHLSSEILQVTYATAYPWPLGADGDGRTLEFKGAALSPNLANSWFSGCLGGSPGTAYLPCDSALLVSEINYKSVSTSDAGDWFELHSLSDQSIDLSNWRITDGGMNTIFTLPSGTVLNPGTYLVFAKDLSLFSSIHPSVTNVLGPTGISLGSTESIRVYDSTNRLHFSVNYTSQTPWPLEANGLGKTMELLSTSGYMCEGTNWFAGCLDGSPGEAYNPVCEEEMSITEQDNNNFVLYPNPVSDVLHATLLENSKIKIVTLNGVKVLEQEVAAGKMHLDVNTLPKGFYIILINGKANRFVKN